MTILSISDIQGLNSTVYLNQVERTELFFTDTNPKQYYFLMRDNQVIGNGVMNGYKDGSIYSYRFDFSKYIRIYNQESPIYSNLDGNGSKRFTSDNTSKLYLYLSNTDTLLTNNISSGGLKVNPDGSIVFNTGSYTSLTATTKVFPTFVDSIDNGLPYRIPYQASIDNYIPITLLDSTTFKYVFKNSYGGVLFTSGNLSKSGIVDVFLLKAPTGSTKVELTFGSTTINLKVSDNCKMVGYYFWNINGGYDSLFCSGVSRDVIDIDRKYINVNGKDTPLKIDIVNKIVHNTGFGLKQEQIYSLIKSPNVNKITYNTSNPINDLMNISLDSFSGYNGMNLNERNLELTFTKPSKNVRATNKKITFYD